MFDIEDMKYFYNPNFEKDQKILDAWYTYVAKFLPLVNKRWRDMTSNDKIRNEQSMFHSITISDEAIVQWFIKLWMPILQKRLLNKIDSLSQGEDEYKSEKKNTRGPHDTKKNIKLYTLLHYDITEARRDYNAAVRWNNLFWTEAKKRNSSLVENRSSSKYSKYYTSFTELPLPDLNENQEFLASYSLVYDTAEAMVNLSPEKSMDKNETMKKLFAEQV
jgi:hypothetical protein